MVCARDMGLKNLEYVELQVVSNFSFLRGASHPEELIEQAANLGYSAIALTDYHSLAGIVRAHFAAKKHNISLIVGATIPLLGLPISLLLYASNLASYNKLCRLLSLGKARAGKGDCLLTIDDLADYHHGLFTTLIIDELSDPLLLNYVKKLKNLFTADRISLAVSNNYHADAFTRNELITQISRFCNIPLIVTNDVHYHLPKRRILQDVLTCIRQKTNLKEAGFLLSQSAERYLKPPEEMIRLFRKTPEAIARTVEVADALKDFSLEQLSYQYPEEICPEDVSAFTYLTQLTWEHASLRYPAGIPAKVEKQIKHELKLIRELSYEKYFLTVYDIVKFARSREILCQGRGAAANSAVCYVLGITAVDPAEVNLLTERFISKERNEPPDIDVDFEHERREEVIQYIYEKYGRERAALAATVITYRTKSAVRDIGKVFSLSNDDIEAIIKLLTRNRDKPLTVNNLEKYHLDPKDRRVIRTIKLSEVLRRFPRHLSQHVGGFIISQQALCEIVPIEPAAMPGRTVIEWDKDDLDRMGMLKIDVLALGMLSCIRKAFKMLENNSQLLKNNHTKPFNLYSIPRKDSSVYKMISNADTIGVFQIESRAQMTMLPRLRPNCFYDLVIEVAIVRPGPIQGGMVHPYLRRRNAEEEVVYPSEEVRSVLEPTLGVPIFQEQVMQLAVIAAGFSPGQADNLRRAMASWRKDGNNLNKFKNLLINGMCKNGYKQQFAEQIFNQILGFGEYGFPQSHAASFAHLVYVSAWLKCHYPAVFAAALLNSQPMGFYRPAQIIRDLRSHGVEVRTVDINKSNWDCSIELDGKKPALRLGLRLVKGLRREEAEALIKSSGDSLTKLWQESGVSVATLKTLARADAFRSIGLDRQKALWKLKKFRDDSLPLFELLRKEADDNSISFVPQFSTPSQVTSDYQTLGFSLKAHPLSFLRNRLSGLGVYSCSEIKEEKFVNGLYVSIAGLVLVRQRPLTASGVVFMTIEDETGLANIIIKPKIFANYRDVICDSGVLLLNGRIQKEGQVLHLLLEEVEDISTWFEESKDKNTGYEFLSRNFH